MTRVRFDPLAEADLNELYAYISDRSGSATAAAGYVRRLFAQCLSLSDFPLRGTARDDLRPGLRTIGFERRATIAFAVEEDGVLILSILYGGRDIERLRPRA